MNEWAWLGVPIKLYKNRLWPEGQRWLIPGLKLAVWLSVFTCISSGNAGLTCSSLPKLTVKFSGLFTSWLLNMALIKF